MLNKDQQAAFEAINNSKPGSWFFVTGGAGTGKSYLIDYLKRKLFGNIVVTATTGAAAQLIGGRTLHSWAQIIEGKGVASLTLKAMTRMRFVDFLIIDEISMASAELINLLIGRFRAVDNHPTVILVGDLLQLPPVKGQYVFTHPIWEKVKVLKLTINHRQDSGSEFLQALNDLRYANITDRVRALIEARTVDKLPDDCTHLHGHNHGVDSTNERRLQELVAGTKETFESVGRKIQAFPDAQIKWDRFRLPERLLICRGARIVMLANSSEGEFVNGSTGEVLDWGFSHDGEEDIQVQLDNGNWVSVQRSTETMLGGDGKIQATMKQFPMKLAWAITVHKAQGLTMDRVGVDLDGHFAPGMTYVALSRCRSVEGLFLVGKFKYCPLPLEITEQLYGRR